ncbi:hypothetical protein [Methylobacterium iners]|uniref:Uncharacterized protein n=1 Tax=Methylobacterium iners TaxID=418707 RepID=A0ABQ4S2Y7_9HYPH|nr:hypothetical protein [Methylobacterium iners]GJD97449.1 hypothetical protein OCOJLMKI_4680 [Methylobacterium iners]
MNAHIAENGRTFAAAARSDPWYQNALSLYGITQATADKIVAMGEALGDYRIYAEPGQNGGLGLFHPNRVYAVAPAEGGGWAILRPQHDTPRTYPTALKALRAAIKAAKVRIA